MIACNNLTVFFFFGGSWSNVVSDLIGWSMCHTCNKGSVFTIHEETL